MEEKLEIKTSFITRLKKKRISVAI